MQDGGGRHLEKSKNCHISAVVWPISNKFARRHTSALLSCPTIKISKILKSKMATAAILKNRKIATPLLRFGRFRQNLASWCSSILLSVPAVKILKILKIQDGSRRRLEKSKNCHISAMVWPISSKFDAVTHVDPLDCADRHCYEIVKKSRDPIYTRSEDRLTTYLMTNSKNTWLEWSLLAGMGNAL